MLLAGLKVEDWLETCCQHGFVKGYEGQAKHHHMTLSQWACEAYI